MRRTVFAILLFGSIAFGQTTRYAGSFLEIPVGAKALGMGDAFVSLADDGTAFHYNPAGTAFIDTKVLSMMYSSQYGTLFAPLSSFFFIGYAQKLQDLSVSIDWVRLSVDNIPAEPDLTVYDSPAQRELLVKTSSPTGYFTSADDAVYLNFSRMFNFNLDMGWSLFKIPVQLPIGINFKIIHRLLGGRAASGIGLDGGFMLRFPFGAFDNKMKTGTFSFGMNVRDMTNTRIAWDTQRNETIPHSLVWGVSYRVPVTILRGDLEFAFNRDSRYGDYLFGAEYLYDKLLSVRVGSDASSLTAGVGILLNFLRVDYAFLVQDLGNVNRISASIYLDRIFK
ncbi:MAG: hypothetical protein M1469_06370 [Bacteroidetes bacterium]|nr:hypothetical protein [Bacteroidota bacterium]